jgi:hypothetical protein
MAESPADRKWIRHIHADVLSVSVSSKGHRRARRDLAEWRFNLARHIGSDVLQSRADLVRRKIAEKCVIRWQVSADQPTKGFRLVNSVSAHQRCHVWMGGKTANLLTSLKLNSASNVVKSGVPGENGRQSSGNRIASLRGWMRQHIGFPDRVRVSENAVRIADRRVIDKSSERRVFTPRQLEMQRHPIPCVSRQIGNVERVERYACLAKSVSSLAINFVGDTRV